MSNDFQEDKQRHLLIKRGDLIKLKQSYLGSVKKNLNTPFFWDKTISSGVNYNNLDPMTKERIKTVVGLINSKSQTVLDLGLGYGYLEEQIRKTKSGVQLSGIDISKKAIKLIKKRIKGTFKQGRIDDIPFKKKFDTVIALEILEHISANKIFSVYKEIRRVLKKNGQLIISVPINENYNDHYNPNRHSRSYSKDLIQAELNLAGFQVIKSKYLFAFKKYYVFKKFLRMLFKNRWKPNVVIVEAISI